MYKAKLGYYLETVQLIKQLRRARHDLPNGHPFPEDADILGSLQQLERRLRQQTPNVENGGLQPFTQLVAFHENIIDLVDKLSDNVHGFDEDLEKEVLDTANDLYDVLQQEVGNQDIFIPTSRNQRYYSTDSFLTGNAERRLYDKLPRITKQRFEDAGKCLTYGMPGAAVSIALQAVESALRYYYRRHGGNNKRAEWKKMLDYLQSEELFPGRAESCYQRLDELRDQYRNAVAHGRARFEESKYEESLEIGIRIFEDCWRAVQLLYSDAAMREQLDLRIHVSPQLDFDTLFATYLFFWNPELPDISVEINFDFPINVAPNSLVDTTINPDNPQALYADPAKPISHHVLESMMVQRSFETTLEILTKFAQQCHTGERVQRLDLAVPKPQDADLYDIFRGLCIMYDDPRKLTNEAWRIFDQFLSLSLSATHSQLVSQLRCHEQYTKLVQR